MSSSPPDELAKYFDVDQLGERVLEPSYNVAPAEDVYVVYESGGVRRLDTFHWGLVPFWAKDIAAGNRMINARAENLAERNAFKHAFKKRRCIIPADGFYEWRKPAPGRTAPGPGAAGARRTKQPFFIHHPEGEPYAFAGLWEVWRGPDKDNPIDEPMLSCTIITGQPNGAVSKIHDRMPVILPPSAWAQWLDRENEDLETLGRLLVPAPARVTAIHAVSTAVNNVRNDGPELTLPEDQ